MALAPQHCSCPRCSSNARFSLRGRRDNKREYHCISASPLGLDLDRSSPDANVVQTAPTDADLVFPNRGRTLEDLSEHDTGGACVRNVSSAERPRLNCWKLCHELKDTRWTRRRFNGAPSCTGNFLSVVAPRKRIFCAALIIQITLLLSAVSNWAWQLNVAAATVTPSSSGVQPSPSSRASTRHLLSRYSSSKSHGKRSGNGLPFTSLEIKEEAQSIPSVTEETESFAAVAAPPTFDGSPSRGAASSSATVTPADGIFPLYSGAGGHLSTPEQPSTVAALASSPLPAPVQLQTGTSAAESMVAGSLNSPLSASLTLFPGELAGTPGLSSAPLAVPSMNPTLGVATPSLLTQNLSAALVAPAGSAAFLSKNVVGSVSGAGPTAALLPGSGATFSGNSLLSGDRHPSETAETNKGTKGVFRQGLPQERLIRPYSPGPTARAASFAATSGIPLCHECASFSDSSSGGGGCSRVCLHGEKTPNFMMPIRALRTIDTHPQEVVQLLEANHHAHLNLNKNFYVLRGKGPFGSLGNSVGSLRRKEDATAAARLGLHFPELPHVSFAEVDTANRVAAGSAAAASSSTSGGNTAAAKYPSDSDDDEAEGRVTERLDLSLAETSVPIMQMKDSQYVGLVGIGTPPQYVQPVFDTGSTNLWVVGSDCKDETCEKVTRFDPHASSTYRAADPPVHLEITFGTGRINGCTAVDNFSIGPFTVKDQTFGLVEKESGHNMHGNIFKSINFEGIVGLAFPEMSSTGAVPLYDRLVQDGKLKANEFAFYMAKGFPVSGLFFGGVDPRFFEPPIHMFPVSREHYWETSLDGIFIGDEKFCCDKPSFVILDSGTSFNTLPGKDMRRLMQRFPPQACDVEDPEFAKAYPPITYVIGGVKFPLKAEEYLVRNDKNECKPAFMQIDVPDEYGPAYILGSVAFMRHYYTVYRRSDGARPSLVGIARAVHSDENKSYLATVLKEFPGVEELEKKGVLSLEKSLNFLSEKEL